jgi:hypothetical protein
MTEAYEQRTAECRGVSVVREFDLNIEAGAGEPEMAYALREVIANALHERALTGTGISLQT